MKMCIFKKLKANRVILWHTCYLGVLRGAELESTVCPAQKWLISHTNGQIQDGRHGQMFISFLLSMVDS